MAEKKEILVLEDAGDTFIEDLNLDNIADMPARKQKELARDAMLELRKRIQDCAVETLQKEVKMKKAARELKAHPTIMAFNQLKKDINRNKKMMEKLTTFYMGGMTLIAKMGLKLDAGTMKQLKELKLQ